MARSTIGDLFPVAHKRRTKRVLKGGGRIFPKEERGI